jgi:hypothetical protein
MSRKVFGISETESTDVLFTPWSIVHFACGGVAKQAGIGFWWWQLAHGAYEMKDFVINGGKGELYNSLWNSVGDQSVTTLGWYLGKHGTLTNWSLGLGASFLTMVALKDRVG